VLRWLVKKVFKTAVVLICVMTAIAVLAYFNPEKFICVDSGKNVSGDVLVVLGGGSHERPLRAAELFKQHVAPRILLTGDGDDEVNRQILLDNGVPSDVIEIENKSTTTHENAVFSIQRLRAEKVHRVVLVTSWYHSRRALKTFEHYAPEIQFYSRPSYYAYFPQDWKKLGINKRMRLEFLKLPGYWLRYGVNPF
jgi:uncharacterized SAM-binding protein YcdF (DUF218 family)